MNNIGNTSHGKPNVVRLLTLNIASPSSEKAARQLAWLNARSDDIVVFTETGVGSGTQMVVSAYRSAGYDIAFEPPPAGERGVMVASRIHTGGAPSLFLSQWSHRFTNLRVQIGKRMIDVVGLYVPSRDALPEKIDRKLRFIRLTTEVLEERRHKQGMIVLGDINVLEPTHEPAYSFFQKWEYDFYECLASVGYDAFRLKHGRLAEYSWVGRTGDGYRYDHAFVSEDVAACVVQCLYNHETRKLGLSDHSALEVMLDGDFDVERIPVTALVRRQNLLF